MNSVELLTLSKKSALSCLVSCSLHRGMTVELLYANNYLLIDKT